LKPIIEDEEEWKTRKIERVEMSFEFLKKKIGFVLKMLMKLKKNGRKKMNIVTFF
jgi:hypothetical protein